MAKQAADMPAQHTTAPYAFVDGTGAFPHSGLLFNCVTGEDKGRRAASDHSNWRPIHDGHPDFVVNFSSRACGACQLALREHARELGKARSWVRPPQPSVMSVTVAQAASATHTRAGERGVQARHGQFRMMCSCAIVPATPTSAKHCRILVGLAVQNAALSRKLKLKQPQRCVLSLYHFPLFVVSGEKVEGICGC